MSGFFNELIGEPVKVVRVVFVFVVSFLILKGLQESNLFSNPVANASLQAGEKATKIVFNGWVIAGAIGSALFLVALIIWFYKIRSD